MLIQPATLEMVRTGRDGRRLLVEDDVLDVARRLKEISESLSLHWNEHGEYFVVVETDEKGDERLVTTSVELNPQLVERVRELAHPSYDFVGEMDRMDRQAEKDKDHRFHERTGEVAEHLAHALRKDLEYGGKAFVPKDVS